MRAAVFHGTRDIRCGTVADAALHEPGDALVRITAASLSGSDLHAYNGLLPPPRSGIPGYECVGVVEDAGAAVRRFGKGQRVLVPALPQGWLEGGALAEAIRVPAADRRLRALPAEISDEQGLWLCGSLAAGWSAVAWADLAGGETVVVLGCGPAGLMAQKSARARGAGRVIATDLLQYRLVHARTACGSSTVNAGETDAVAAVLEETGGQGADLVIDAVGMQAGRSLLEKAAGALQPQHGSIKALEQAFALARPGGRVSVLGVYAGAYDHFPLGLWRDKGLTVRAAGGEGGAPVDALLGLLGNAWLETAGLVSHRLALADATRGFQLFNDKQDDCLKLLLLP